MEKSAIFHQSNSQYSYFVSDTRAVVILRTKREDSIRSIRVLWNTGHRFCVEQLAQPMELYGSDLLADYYMAVLDNGDPGYGYIFEITDGDGGLWYYNESGFSRQMCPERAFEDNFSLVFPNERDIIRPNRRFEGRVFYQIFPERFCRSTDKANTAYINMDWNTDRPDNEHFAGGDLNGIREKLPYLQELGIGAIYMTPIHPSVSAHKYDIDDYFAIDPMFGTMEDFKALVQEAHCRDILIVMDLVFNHSSFLNPLFQDVVRKGRESRYYHWYYVDGDKPEWDKRNYKTFSDVAMMPKLNTNNPEVQEYLTRVGEFYLAECKVDGFRLDVAFDVSHDFWRFFKKRLQRIDPQVYLIGEDWQNSYAFLGNDQWDSVMNYPFLYACRRYLAEDRYDADGFVSFLTGVLMRYEDGTNRNMLNLLDSHDIHRFFTLLQEDVNRQLMAQGALIFYLGSPMLYYGDEVFMTGGQDPLNRRPMEWYSPRFVSEEHAFLKKLLALRREDVLRYGDIRLYTRSGVACIRRSYQGRVLTLALNHSGAEQSLPEGKLLFGRRVQDGRMENDSLAVLEG